MTTLPPFRETLIHLSRLLFQQYLHGERKQDIHDDTILCLLTLARNPNHFLTILRDHATATLQSP